MLLIGLSFSFFFFFFLCLYSDIQFFGKCGEKTNTRKAKANLLYEKKKTAAKFSFASVPLLVNLVHSS